MPPPVLKMWALIASRPPHSMMARARSIVDVAWKFVVKCTRPAEEAIAAGAPPSGSHRISIGWMREAPRDRKSVVEGKRVDLGGRRIIKKKKKGETLTRVGV